MMIFQDLDSNNDDIQGFGLERRGDVGVPRSPPTCHECSEGEGEPDEVIVMIIIMIIIIIILIVIVVIIITA